MSEQLSELFREELRTKPPVLESLYGFPRNSKKKYLDGKLPVLTLIADPTPNWWSIAVINGVLQDVAPPSKKFDVGKLRPCWFFKGRPRDVTTIRGDKMRERAVELKGNLGHAHGKRMLAEQYKIPAKFRDYYIPLPGTVLCKPKIEPTVLDSDWDDQLFLPYLCYDNEKWVLGLNLLDYDWPDNGRLAVY